MAWFRRGEVKVGDPMPVVTGPSSLDEDLYKEIKRRVKAHTPKPDSFYYNGGTVVSLLLTGAATVAAPLNVTVASICSATAAFVIAVSRSLNFGGRWRWHLQRQNTYSKSAYELNKIALLPEGERPAAYRALLDELARQRDLDAHIPGAGEPVGDDPDAGDPSADRRLQQLREGDRGQPPVG